MQLNSILPLKLIVKPSQGRKLQTYAYKQQFTFEINQNIYMLMFHYKLILFNRNQDAK